MNSVRLNARSSEVEFSKVVDRRMQTPALVCCCCPFFLLQLSRMFMIMLLLLLLPLPLLLLLLPLRVMLLSLLLLLLPLLFCYRIFYPSRCWHQCFCCPCTRLLHHVAHIPMMLLPHEAAASYCPYTTAPATPLAAAAHGAEAALRYSCCIWCPWRCCSICPWCSYLIPLSIAIHVTTADVIFQRKAW